MFDSRKYPERGRVVYIKYCMIKTLELSRTNIEKA